MKSLLVVVVFVLVATCAVEGHGGGGRGRGRWGHRFWKGWGGLRFCSCQSWYNPCYRNTGDTQLGCHNTNAYIECNNTVCSRETCPTGEVWNSTLDECAACSAGKHVNAEGQKCVCDQGTTEDQKTKQCVACPTGATVEPDECYCPSGLALDKTANECKACPTGASLSHSCCYCNNATLFFNQNTWTCDECPGEWLPKARRGRWGWHHVGRQECTCDSTQNQIFDRRNVRCYTCPTGTTAVRNSCLCALRLQWFNIDTEACECIEGYDLNPDGTACERTTTDGGTGTGSTGSTGGAEGGTGSGGGTTDDALP